MRLWRLVNSRHPKTGLHKVRLELRELMHLDADGDSEAGRRAPAVRPAGDPAGRPGRGTRTRLGPGRRGGRTRVPGEGRAADGGDAAAGGPDRLNRATLDFIAGGAGTGDRHRLLYSAAANLAEFDCPPRLAFALLMPAALDSGLAPADAVRQIECGLRTAGPPTGRRGVTGCRRIPLRLPGRPARRVVRRRAQRQAPGPVAGRVGAARPVPARPGAGDPARRPARGREDGPGEPAARSTRCG